MNSSELRFWINKYEVEKRTIQGFRDVVDNFIKDNPSRIIEYFGENFDMNLLMISMYKVSFTIGNWPESDFNYITSFARIEYKNKDMGVYKLVFNLDGEIEDDYWVSDDN